MGNIDSIPVVSQAKSLVQVIGGDEAGARKTQEQFARTGIIASQVNSLVHSIQGNNREAEKIQEEFGLTMYEVAKGTPVIGHGIAAGHAFAGNHQEAEHIANVATKSTVSIAAGSAGLLCGPGAPACAAGLAVAASHVYDAVEGEIRGQLVGSIKAWDDLVNGKSDVGQGFDIVAGTLLEAGGAALGVKALKGKTTISKTVGLGLMKGKKARIRPTLRCRRSIQDNPGFGLDQPDVSSDLLPRLPGSFKDLSFSESMPGISLVDNVLSIFLVLQLMKIRHPRSRPYFNEICTSHYITMAFDDCTSMILNSLQKYDQTESNSISGTTLDSDSKPGTGPNNFLTDILETLELEIESFTSNNMLSYIMEAGYCGDLDKGCHNLVTALKSGLKKINKWLKSTEIKVRRKRDVCGPRLGSTKNFKIRHLSKNGRAVLGTGSRKVIDLNNAFLKKFFARDGATNTVLNKLEFENAIRSNNYKKIGVDQIGNDLFETTVPIRGRNSVSNGAEIIDSGSKQMKVKFSVNSEGKISHLDGHNILE